MAVTHVIPAEPSAARPYSGRGGHFAQCLASNALKSPVPLRTTETLQSKPPGTEVGHRWRPIEDLPEDWQSLADRDLGHLADFWNESREEMASHGAVRAFNERLGRQWAIETGLIERIYTLDRGTAEILLERGIHANLIAQTATNRDPELVSDIIRDHETALDGLFIFVKRERDLSTSFVKELHSVLLAHQDTATARNTFGRRVEMPLAKGQYKRRPNSPVRPDGLIHEYCPPEQVASEMDRLVEMHARHVEAGVVPEVEAAWLHHRFAQIHPFQDGNGRVARALATLVMIRAGWLALVVTDAMRSEYLEALEAADRGNLAPLVKLFADIQRRAIYGAVAEARHVIAEKRQVRSVIQSVADKLDRRLRRRQGEWEKAKDIGQALGATARDHLGRVEAELKSVLASQLGTSGGFWVTSSPDDDPDRRSYYGYQVVETAKAMRYFANTRVFHSWAALNLKTDGRHEILVSIHGMGHEFAGLLVATACLAKREASGEAGEQGGTVVTRVQPVCERPFQISYKEDPADARTRFGRWIGDAVVQGLLAWQEDI